MQSATALKERSVQRGTNKIRNGCREFWREQIEQNQNLKKEYLRILNKKMYMG